MAFCKYCGKQIADGEACDCQQAMEQAQGGEKTKSSTDMGAKIVIGAAAVVVILIIVLLASLLGGGGYKKPVENIAKAFNKADGKALINAMFTDDLMEEFEDMLGDDKDDLYDQFDELLEEVMDEAEDEFGKNVKFSIKVTDKDKLDKDELEEIEDYYKDYLDTKVKISAGYELECEMSIKGKDDEEENDMDITVVKIKGEGWKVAMNGMGDFSGILGMSSLLY